MGEPYRSPTLLIYLKGGENDRQHSASLGNVMVITWTRPKSCVSFPALITCGHLPVPSL
jgi:hypothetical protein